MPFLFYPEVDFQHVTRFSRSALYYIRNGRHRRLGASPKRNGANGDMRRDGTARAGFRVFRNDASRIDTPPFQKRKRSARRFFCKDMEHRQRMFAGIRPVGASAGNSRIVAARRKLSSREKIATFFAKGLLRRHGESIGKKHRHGRRVGKNRFGNTLCRSCTRAAEHYRYAIRFAPRAEHRSLHPARSARRERNRQNLSRQRIFAALGKPAADIHRFKSREEKPICDRIRAREPALDRLRPYSTRVQRNSCGIFHPAHARYSTKLFDCTLGSRHREKCNM